MGPINWDHSYTPVYYENGKKKYGFFPSREKAINDFFAIDANNDGQSDYRTNDWRDFFTALGVMESDFNFGADNKRGYYGKYQQGIDMLKDTKFFDKEGKPIYCVNDLKDFLKNPYAQEIAALRELSFPFKLLAASR